MVDCPTGKDIDDVCAFNGYWHDTGHVPANEVSGPIAGNALLRKYADWFIGIHLHDAIGLDDHIPPGAGEIDFTAQSRSLRRKPSKLGK